MPGAEANGGGAGGGSMFGGMGSMFGKALGSVSRVLKREEKDTQLADQEEFVYNAKHGAWMPKSADPDEWAKENRNTEGLLSYRVVASGMTHLLFDLNYSDSSAASDGSVSPRSYGGASPRSTPRSAAAMVNTPRSGPMSPPRYRHVGASGFFDEPLARMSERSGSSVDARMSRRRASSS